MNGEAALNMHLIFSAARMAMFGSDDASAAFGYPFSRGVCATGTEA
jgi:hypothetical protein